MCLTFRGLEDRGDGLVGLPCSRLRDPVHAVAGTLRM